MELHNLHGSGRRLHPVYAMPPAAPAAPRCLDRDEDGNVLVDCHCAADYWAAVTDVPCPVEGCPQRVVWYEAGQVPGYRGCTRSGPPDPTIRHRFLAGGTAAAPTLIRDDCCEDGR
jgi:hypothetical protein